MIHVDELKNLWTYRKPTHLPTNVKDKRKGSVVVLLTPNIKASINTINHPLLINKYHKGYYIEKDITYFINNENYNINAADSENLTAITEDTILTDGVRINSEVNLNMHKWYDNSLCIKTEDGVMISAIDDLDSVEALNEGSIQHNAILKKILYKERLRTPKEVVSIYDRIKDDCMNVNRTYLDYKKYKNLNLYVDFYYYNESFFKNNLLRLNKGLDLYLDFITRFFKDKRLKANGYNMEHVIIPVDEWAKVIGNANIQMYNETINPISIIYRLIKTDIERLKAEWGNIPFIFTSKTGYFKVDFSTITKKDANKFLTLINVINRPDFIPDDVGDDKKESKKSMVTKMVDKIEISSNIKINNLTGSSGEATKDEIVKRIDDAAASSKDVNELEKQLDQDDHVKKLLMDAAGEEDNSVKINMARRNRMNTVKNEFMKKSLSGSTVEEILAGVIDSNPIPTMNLNIDSPNEEWKVMESLRHNELYDPEEDLLMTLDSLSAKNKSMPIAVRNIKKEDVSTSEDYIDRYTVEMEDSFGKRFSIVLDIPQLKDNQFLVLKGNEKSINNQMYLLPVVKTGDDTVQVVSNYNKIFLNRYGVRTFAVSDRIIKALNKVDSKKCKLKLGLGDCSRANNGYAVPMDYAEIANGFLSIETSTHVISFNQKELHEKFKIKSLKDEYIVGWDKKNNKPLKLNHEVDFSRWLHERLKEDAEYLDKYESANLAKRYAYTRASILAAKIPLIVLLAFNEGLFTVLKKANIEYQLHDKRPMYSKETEDLIKFSDGYLTYKLDYESSLLMNGLKECGTENYTIAEMNNKATYLDFLEKFGGRIISDGLENFYESFIDHITEEVLKKYNLPIDYTELLIYASNLLADTSYNRHTDLNTVRYRSNEVISACIYKAISQAYGNYRTEVKRKRKNAKLNIKRTAVLDEILMLNITADASNLSPVLEAETIKTVSWKGPSGMNSERAFGLEERAFDDTMLNVIGMSTPQGPGVGINRQMTVDMNIEGKRGYIKTIKSIDEFSASKTFTVSESTSPYGATRNDPPRTSMDLSQAKHMMRINHGDPLLVTTGGDQVLPYMTTNNFSFKTKERGEVIALTDNFAILKYRSGKTDMVDLRPKVKKNSSSGFFILIKNSPIDKLKVGYKFKENEILAYDKLSYSNSAGHTDNISTIPGLFTKIAVVQTDEGFEDSGIVSNKVSEKMAADIIIKKDVVVNKNANIYNMAKVGEHVQEGDTLMIFQNAYDDKDVSVLLRNLVKDEESITEIGRIPIHSKYTGDIQDIKMYRTIDKDELSPSLKKEFNKHEAANKKLKNILKKYDVEHYNRYVDPDYKLDPTGKLKAAMDSVLIEFYIKYRDKMSIGDKLTFQIALKVIIRDIFPKGKEPFTDFRSNEEIGALLSLSGVNNRMTCSIKPLLVQNKILVETVRQVRDILGIPYDIATEFDG